MNSTTSHRSSNSSLPAQSVFDARGSGDRPTGGPLYPVFVILLILSKQRKRLIGLCALVPILALWILPLLPKSYKSEAVIQVRKSLSTAISEDVGLKPTEAAGQISEDYRVVQTALLESKLLHDGVGKKLLERGYFEGSPSLKGQARELVLALFSSGAEQGYVDHAVLEARRAEDAGGFVASGLSVRRGHKSPKIALSFQDSNPERAYEVLTTLLNEYQASLVALYDIEPILTEATLHFDQAETDWAAARVKLRDFEETNVLQDPERQIEAARYALANVVSNLTNLRLQYAQASSKVGALENAQGLVPSEFDSSPTRFENRYRWMILDLLTAARKRLVQSPFLEGTPEYSALQEPIEELLEELNEQKSLTIEANAPIPNTSHYKVVADLALARAEKESSSSALDILVDRVSQLNTEIDRLALLLPAHQDLRRAVLELASIRDEKREHIEKVRRVKNLADADLLWSFKVLQNPTLPSSASSPGRSILFAGLLFVGVGMAVLCTLFLGLLDRSIREGRELEKLVGVRPLALFPDLGKRSEVSRLLGRVGRGFFGRLESKRLSKHRSESLNFSKLGPHAVVLESRLDSLISAVERERPKGGQPVEGPHVFAVGGAHSGVGATTIAINLARRLSERNQGRTLLALRRGGSSSIQAELSVDSTNDYQGSGRLGNADVLLYTENNLSGARDWARELGRGYDHVIVDAPPVLNSSQSLDLLSGADVALLVARGDVTKRNAMEEAVHAVNNAGNAQVGLVLNAHHSRLPDILTCA